MYSVSQDITLSRLFKSIVNIVLHKQYAFITLATTISLAVIIPSIGFYISGVWIYRFSSPTEIFTVLLILLSYLLTGIFTSLFIYIRRSHIKCKGGLYLGLTGSILSVIGCCSPIVYILFIIGFIGSAVVPYLSIVLIISIIILLISILILAYRIENEARSRELFTVSET